MEELEKQINEVNSSTDSLTVLKIMNEINKIEDSKIKADLLKKLNEQKSIKENISSKENLINTINNIKSFYTNEKLLQIRDDILNEDGEDLIELIGLFEEKLEELNITLEEETVVKKEEKFENENQKSNEEETNKPFEIDNKQQEAEIIDIPEKEEEKVESYINEIKKGIIICAGAVGITVLLGSVILSNKPKLQNDRNISTEKNIDDDKVIDEKPLDNVETIDDEKTVVNIDNLLDSYYTSSVTHNGKVLSEEESFNNARLNNLYNFLDTCGYELEEIHDTNPNRRLEMIKEFNGLPKDGSRRFLIDNCNGDTKKMFGYISLSLCDDKKVKLNGESYIDKNSINNYGMEYWIRSKDEYLANINANDFDTLLEYYNNYMKYMYKLVEKQGYTYEEAVNIIDNESENGLYYLTSKEVEEFEDIAYTIFDNFYKEQGIDDYYYILDNEEDYAEILIEDIESKDKSTYIPMKDRGGYEYQKSLY